MEVDNFLTKVYVVLGLAALSVLAVVAKELWVYWRSKK